ncbi:MAG: hypothetical protein ACT4PL_04905 [Phycisphaerales bacterium]
MTMRTVWNICLTAGTLAALAGCNADQQQQQQPAPAPKAAAPAAKVEPKATGNCATYRPGVGAGWNLSTAFFPSGDAASSAILVNQVLPASVRLGQPYTYEIHVTNITQGTLQNVMVSNKNLTNLAMTGSVPASTAAADGSAMWNLGELGPCKTSIIKVTGKADKVGVSSNCIGVAYNNAMCAATNVVEPKIEIVKGITPESILNCTPIEMTVKVTNPGSGMAENVVVKDNLPAGLTTADGKQMIEIAMGNLGPGESKTQAVALKAGKTGKFDNKASVMAAGGLSAESNTVSTVVKQPVLEITCKAGAERVILGRDARFDLTVSNKGDAACSTQVSVPVPSGATFVSATEGGAMSGGSIVWNVGNLAAGGNKTVSFMIKPSGMTAVAITGTATCQCAQPVSTTCSTNVIGIPALLLDGVDDPDPVLVGDNVTYTLRVTNQGFANLTNVKLACTMDKNMQFVSASGPTGAGTANGMAISFPVIPVLAPKETRVYTIVIKSTGEGQVSFRAEASSTEITVPLIKSETTNFYK